MISPQRSINSIQRVGTPKDLRKDYTTIIKKPDKANCIVTVSELDYLNKMKQPISDQPKFKKLRHNSMKSREDSLIAYLLKLRQDNIIDDATLQKILPSASHPGVLYSLPKLHKSGCPFRCIVSSFNTYNYNHASYLVCLLKHVSTNQFTIKDFPSFAEWAMTYSHNNEFMRSLDALSLFPNVPLDETIKIGQDKLYA